MLLNLFILAVIPTQAGHASLHPADATLYIEVPDLPALGHAYLDAPLAQFLSDPQIEGFAGLLAGEDPEEYRLDEAILSQIEAALTSADPALAGVFDLLSDARAASLSFTLRQGEPTDEWPSGFAASSLLAAMEFSSAEAATRAALTFGGLMGEHDVEADAARELAVDWLGVEATLWMEVRAATLFLGVGEGSREGLAMRFEAPESALGANPDFSEGRRRLELTDGVAVYEFFLHLREIPQALIESGLPLDLEWQAAIAAGVEALFPGGEHRSHQRTRLVGSRFIKEGFVHDSSERPGLFGAMACSPVSLEALDLLPANAVGAWVTTLDPRVLSEELQRLVALGTGVSVEELQTQLQLEFGFDPMADLIGSLGTRCVFYTLPITGLAIPKVHAAIDLADPEAFQRGVEGLGRLVTELTGGEVGMKMRAYRKLPVYTFAPRQDIGDLAGSMGAPSEFVNMVPNVIESELALTIMDGRVILGIGDQGVKREIKRLLLQDRVERHPLASGEFAIPEDATSVGFIDWGSIFKGIYDTVRAFVPLIAQAAEDLPFELSDLPDAEVFTSHWKPTLSWSRRLPGGTYSREESSFGPEIPFAVGMGGATAAMLSSRGERSLVAPPPEPRAATKPRPVPEPAPSPVVGSEDPNGTTRELLLNVKLALVVYRTDQGQYPGALTELFEPTPRFPQGFLDQGTSLSDAWSRELRYEVGAQGASFSLWSLGPDGIDDRGAGDDLSLR